MIEEAPFPITNELLRNHPLYERTQSILSGWYAQKLRDGPLSVVEWRQSQLNTLELVDGKRSPDKNEWFWNNGRDLTARQLLYEFVSCTHHDEPDVRMLAWRKLQNLVALWDQKYANDTDVA